MSATTQYLPLWAGEFNTNNTNNEVDGEYRTPWPYGTPTPYRTARFEAAIEFEQGTTVTDLVLRDFTAGSNIASTGNISSDSTREIVEFDPTDLDPGDEIGFRANNTTASGVAGSEAWAIAHVVLVP
jgi:hypothetical protein